MNYIHQLQDDGRAMSAEIQALRNGINRLRAHLTSSKFHHEPTIQVGDVERWLQDILASGSDASVTRYR